MSKSVIIIGGGIAGLEAAASFDRMGVQASIIEKDEELGGHLINWERLFPTKRLGIEVLNYLKKGLSPQIKTYTNTQVSEIKKNGNLFELKTNHGETILGDAVLIATGYDTFDASKKEEYGYGIYDNVITSADLEKIFIAKNRF